MEFLCIAMYGVYNPSFELPSISSRESPIKAKINFKILTYMYNCSVGNAPKYLSELLTYKVSKRTLRSSKSSVGCFEVPYNRKNTFRDRNFNTIGPRLWNALPLELRQSGSVHTFKRHLKTYFKSSLGCFVSKAG